MMQRQEIIPHNAVTPKHTAIVRYIFTLESYPIKAGPRSEVTTHAKMPYIIRNAFKKCCNNIDTAKITMAPIMYIGVFHSYLYVSK